MSTGGAILSRPGGGLFRIGSFRSSAPRRWEACMRAVAGRSGLEVIEISILLGWLAASGPFLVNPTAAANHVVAAEDLDRTVLPIPEPQYPPITELDVRNAKAPPR